MASDKLGWIFELVDKMSGPAARIQRALGRVQSAIGASLNGGFIGRVLSRLPPVAQVAMFRLLAFAQSVREVGGVSKLLGASMNGGRIGQVLARLPPVAQRAMFHMFRFAGVLRERAGPALRAIQQRAGPALQTIGKGLSWAGDGLKRLAGGIASFAGKAATFAGGAAIGLGALGAMYALDAFAFKENTLAGFSTMLKSDAAARRVMQDAIQFAAVTPFETRDVLEAYRRLLVAGFRESDLRAVMTTIGDVGAAFGQEAMESVIRGVAQVRAKGKLQGEELMQLSEAGIGSGAVFDALSKKLGRTREQVQALVSAGKIDSDTGIAAVLEAITQSISGGKAGSLMEKQSQTISGLLSTLASKPFEFMIALNEQEILAPAKRFITALSEALDPKTAVGARIIALLQTVGTAIGSIFGDQSSSFEMSGSLQKVLDVLEPLAKMALALGRGFFAAMKPMASLFDRLGDTDTAKVDRLARAFGAIGQALASVVATNVVGILVLVDAIGKVMDAGVRLWDWFAAVPGRMRQFGSDAVRGFIDGVVSMLPTLAMAMGGGPGAMVGVALATVQGALDSHSPSREMAHLGVDSTLGYIEGVRQPNLPAAMADTFSPSAMSLGAIGTPAPTPPWAAGTGGGGGAGRAVNVSLVINASGGTTREQAEELADLAVSRLTTMLEQGSMELGVG